jgi:hypothetical protein
MHVEVSISQGQQEARTRWGTHESGAAFDRKKCSFLTDEAREFIAQQVMGVLVGPGLEQEPRGLLLAGPPGFVETPDAFTCLLPIERRYEMSGCMQGIKAALDRDESPRIVLCFVQHVTRQRICVQGEANLLPARSPEVLWLRIRVSLAFFHCPKYVHTRVAGLHTVEDAQLPARIGSDSHHLSADVCAFLARQALCYLCTVDKHGQYAVNHRGGAQGFLVTLQPDRLIPGGVVLLPDYAGNGAFEALGNILETGKAALLVPGYAEQIMLCLTGEAVVLEPRQVPEFLRAKCRGAQRVVALTVQHVERQDGAWQDALVYERTRAQKQADMKQTALSCPL